MPAAQAGIQSEAVSPHCSRVAVQSSAFGSLPPFGRQPGGGPHIRRQKRRCVNAGTDVAMKETTTTSACVSDNRSRDHSDLVLWFAITVTFFGHAAKVGLGAVE